MPEIVLNINGFDRTLQVDAHEMLLDTIRETFYLSGTKKGCDQASCGSCTVWIDGSPILSCITPSMRCVGKKITTIEGVAQKGNLHPLQEQLVKTGGIQCGYCTPGMVMTSIPFLLEKKHPTEEGIREALSGNLCRCTGYAKIIEAVQQTAQENPE